jgi:hypothetical protein
MSRSLVMEVRPPSEEPASAGATIGQAAENFAGSIAFIHSVTMDAHVRSDLAPAE